MTAINIKIFLKKFKLPVLNLKKIKAMVNVQLPKVLFRDFNSTYNVYLHNMQFCHSMWNLLL